MASEPVLSCVEDFEPYLKAAVPDGLFPYFRSKTDRDQTLQDNTLAFQRYRLRPRYLRDVSQRDTGTSILGHRLAFPVGVSPTGCQVFIHKDAEVATAKGVSNAGSAMILSMWSNTSLEDVAASMHPGTPLFLQLNIIADRGRLEMTIRRAEALGFKALVITVDQPITERNVNVNPTSFAFPVLLPPGEKMKMAAVKALIDGGQVVTWKDIVWLRGITSLPVVLKGIVTAEDAREAVKHGAAGILVSNHGGRQLDGVPATIDVLAEVVDAVRGSDVEVYLDGGVRRGTDVLKALAMGARAVFIGRPALWGLAYDGEKGVEKVLRMLKDEFNRAMALCGCSSVSDITSEFVTTQQHGKV